MKCLFFALVLIACLSTAQSSWWWPPCWWETEVCYYIYGCFSDNAPFNNAKCKVPQQPEDMGLKLKLYNSPNQLNPINIDYNYPYQVKFELHLPTKFIIHGFTDSSDAVWVNDIKDELLKQEPMNVILVDWNLGASQSYSQSASNTRLVARMLSVFILDLYWSGLDLENVHLIGHSLGAHTSGQVGSDLYGLVGRITGLDPAGPYFDCDEPLIRLDSTDAKFVDVIHTDSEHLIKLGFGMIRRMGDVDFLPQGGFEQVECPKNMWDTLQKVVDGFSAVKETAACSHNRAQELFLDSISRCQYWSSACSNYENYGTGLCTCTPSKDKCNQMGYHADPTKPGQYYIDLVGSEPFCAVPASA